MLDLAVIDDSAAAEASLDPVRAALLAALVEPGSATTLAAKIGLARQKVNYHLRALERFGLGRCAHANHDGPSRSDPSCARISARCRHLTSDAFRLSPLQVPEMDA